ncbi:tetratricopeptide repeat protein [Allosaccharopolyspora coralli]|uniref:Tetratricopeptide repeat protein n=1 Tax=Allosaccharopolyspora coralli TaxID=2665642 RepID=A0A5Q3Q4T1_9PSEU|nr:AfsR/SARP family transcriptional regulator [Allosaccharopolyspora coralli]QGK68506.1 tetratricopeptide repeat protein [Allosaccharopolyspora coralli]
MAPQESSTTAPSTGFDFRVLGPLEVLHDAEPQRLGRPRVRATLACLLLEPNQVVSMDRIIETLWGDEPPASARTIIHGYISRIRKLFAEKDDGAPDDVPQVVTRPPGYLIRLDSDRVDAHRARALVNHAQHLEPEERSRVLTDALTLWRGPVLQDIDSERLHRTVVPNLDELRLLALEERIDADLACSRHQSLVVELSTVVDEHPLRERLAGQLILAHYRSGHRAEAQARYHALREKLSHELGIDPGPELRKLYDLLLRDDDSLLTGEQRRQGSAAAPAPAAYVARPVPAELPPAPAGFVGRLPESAALDAMVEQDTGTPNRLAVLTGTAGVGKSALAITWSHRVAHRFPDGQLYASLRGFDSERTPLSPAEALTSILKTLGVAADAIPVGLDDRAALYRSLLADRRVLVLLDNARDSEQVRLLLPAGTKSLVVITSRRRLDGLVVGSGAEVLPLETLSTDVAVELLDRAGIPGRSTSEPAATRRLAELCGGLPLALRIAAARLAVSPGRGAGDLVDELTDERDRLHAFDVEDADTSVRRAFDISYRSLHATHASTFRMLGLVPGHTFTPHVVAALCGTEPAGARRRLRALALAHLVTEPEPDRFGMHDLLRLYARDLVADEHRPAAGDESALRRLVHYYMVVADRARRFLRPPRDSLDFTADTETVSPVIGSRAQALEWFDAEWPNLVATIRVLNARGMHELCWPLVRLQFNYVMVRCPWEDWIQIYTDGLDSARAVDDTVGSLLMSAGIGVAYSRSQRPAQALPHYAESYRGALAGGDPGWQAMAQVNMGAVLVRLERYDEARGYCWDALQTYRTLGDRYRQAGALNNLAQTEQAAGRREEALSHLVEAEAMCREADDLETLAVVLSNCGEVSLDLGRAAEAERYHHEALDVALRCGSAMRQASAYVGLGDAATARGDRAVARTRWETALGILETVASRRAGEVHKRLDEFVEHH